MCQRISLAFVRTGAPKNSERKFCCEQPKKLEYLQYKSSEITQHNKFTWSVIPTILAIATRFIVLHVCAARPTTQYGFCRLFRDLCGGGPARRWMGPLRYFRMRTAHNCALLNKSGMKWNSSHINRARYGLRKTGGSDATRT